MVKRLVSIKGKKILVTGATGFIAGHLTEELLRLGANVIIPHRKIDKKSYFYLNEISKKVILEKVDLTNKKRVFEIIKKHKPDYIYHLAAQTTVVQAFNDPYETLTSNILGTIHILEAVRLNDSVKGIIVASSDKAYGRTQSTYTEESPLRGDHPYDVSKTCTDYIAQMYYKTYKMPVVVTRFGNVYGEGDLNFDRIIPSICTSMITQKKLEIRSDGTYIRDYLYVKDVVQGYITLLKNINTIHGEAYNFSSKDTFSVLDLVKKIEKIIQQKIDYSILNNAKNEIPYQHLNDKKVRKLGWKNQYSLDTTFQQILQWYAQIL